MEQSLPDTEIMYSALVNKDSNFEGIFMVGVKTTGIFCRPTCTARKPKPENVEFFSTAHEALMSGYRPCKVCSPLNYKGTAPEWLKPLLDEINENPSDQDTKQRPANQGFGTQSGQLLVQETSWHYLSGLFACLTDRAGFWKDQIWRGSY